MVAVLLSSAGRRVELLQCLRQDISHLSLDAKVVAADASRLTAAGHLADDLEVVPRLDDPLYVDALIDVVLRHDIRLVVPTIDTELEVLSAAMVQLRDAGATVLASSVEATRISLDKCLTHAFLTERGLPRPTQWTAARARLEAPNLPYPVIVKPRRGSSSVGVVIVSDEAGLHAALTDPTQLVQTIAAGDEYTVDVWVDRAGTVRSAVPRRRIETRGGEVSKGVTARKPEVIDLATRVAEALPEAYGPLTIQIFADGHDLKVIEINARLGGGYPLSWHAGARTTQWAIQDAFGHPLEPAQMPWREGLLMLRHDRSVFIDAEGLTRD